MSRIIQPIHVRDEGEKYNLLPKHENGSDQNLKRSFIDAMDLIRKITMLVTTCSSWRVFWFYVIFTDFGFATLDRVVYNDLKQT
jgi:hypothetical protein